MWPLTAAALDWLRRPAPPLLRRRSLSAAPASFLEADVVQRRCVAGGPRTLCGLHAPTHGWVTLKGFHQHHWPRLGAIHSRAGCRENKARLCGLHKQASGVPSLPASPPWSLCALVTPVYSDTAGRRMPRFASWLHRPLSAVTWGTCLTLKTEILAIPVSKVVKRSKEACS